MVFAVVRPSMISSETPAKVACFCSKLRNFSKRHVASSSLYRQCWLFRQPIADSHDGARDAAARAVVGREAAALAGLRLDDRAGSRGDGGSRHFCKMCRESFEFDREATYECMRRVG
ncbi:uncharacterized protein EKO05_0010593 [Ascochyta rabiei]|uniref:uncharacterized protein n=1 Tax=Didymella rabiei TaxID=5454 RepID=UPI0021F97B12|nr:uncharacterized protein EKO05_0010593 [Ascochyta rabiei]UPX20359.1 hypothetical protein EKO05_0010593 [Ascochyta rabiei]